MPTEWSRPATSQVSLIIAASHSGRNQLLQRAEYSFPSCDRHFRRVTTYLPALVNGISKKKSSVPLAASRNPEM